MQKKLSELELIKAENRTLKEFSNLSQKFKEYTTVAAYIIEKDITNFSNEMVINIGENDGIKPNMPVISHEGLVGFTISTTKNTSKVVPIIDPACSVSSVLVSTREVVMAKGIQNVDNKLKLTYIPPTTDLMLEDGIETSGIGGIYPKGLPVGKIKEIIPTNNITDRYGIVETYVDFTKLENILVIITDT